jgi:hypothetical protein
MGMAITAANIEKLRATFTNLVDSIIDIFVFIRNVFFGGVCVAATAIVIATYPRGVLIGIGLLLLLLLVLGPIVVLIITCCIARSQPKSDLTRHLETQGMFGSDDMSQLFPELRSVPELRSQLIPDGFQPGPWKMEAETKVTTAAQHALDFNFLQFLVAPKYVGIVGTNGPPCPPVLDTILRRFLSCIPRKWYTVGFSGRINLRDRHAGKVEANKAEIMNLVGLHLRQQFGTMQPHQDRGGVNTQDFLLFVVIDQRHYAPDTELYVATSSGPFVQDEYGQGHYVAREAPKPMDVWATQSKPMAGYMINERDTFAIPIDNGRGGGGRSGGGGTAAPAVKKNDGRICGLFGRVKSYFCTMGTTAGSQRCRIVHSFRPSIFQVISNRDPDPSWLQKTTWESACGVEAAEAFVANLKRFPNLMQLPINVCKPETLEAPFRFTLRISVRLETLWSIVRNSLCFGLIKLINYKFISDFWT